LSAAEFARLEFRQLLGRFIDVCNAIAYAHSRGVLHRDLKPGNIMLSKYGETLVVDWGLAKVIGRKSSDDDARAENVEGTLRPSSASGTPETLAGSAVGTPAFMSPEQAAGRLDELGPASDVYSLGATLYSLLTGKAPFEGPDKGKLLRCVEQGDFPPPSHERRYAPKALEVVCLQAMALRPADRYTTPLELAQAVEQWLADEPVTGYAEPVLVRAGRFVRKHKALVATGAAVLVTAVVALSVGLAAVRNEQRKTQTALDAEARRRQQARDGLDAMSSQVVDDWLAKQKELSPQHKEFLQKALASYEEFASDNGQDQGTRTAVGGAYFGIGRIRWKLGLAAEAEEAWRRAYVIFAQLHTEFPNDPVHRENMAKCLNNLGTLLGETTRQVEAEQAFRDALTIGTELTDAFPQEQKHREILGISYFALGILLVRFGGRNVESEQALRQALAIREALLADFPDTSSYRESLAKTWRNLGVLLQRQVRIEQAQEAQRNAIAILRQLSARYPDEPSYREELAGASQFLANVLGVKRSREAEDAYKEAIGINKQLAQDYPRVPSYRIHVGACLHDLGQLIDQEGRGAAAEEFYREALKIFKQLAKDFPSLLTHREFTANCSHHLGILLKNSGRLKEAEECYLEALAIRRQMVSAAPDSAIFHNVLAGVMVDLADLSRLKKDTSSAQRFLEEALVYHRAAMKADPVNPHYREFYSNNRFHLALTLLDLRDHRGTNAATEEYLNSATNLATDSYDAACLYARSIPLATEDKKLTESERQELAPRYADKAIAALRQAIQNGFKDGASMKKDPDLNALCSRADFKELIQGLEIKPRRKASEPGTK